MPHLSEPRLVDSVVVLLVLAAVAGRLLRGRGVVSALTSGAAAALAAWLVVLGLATWGSGPLADGARHSRTASTLPAPDRVVAEAGDLLGRLSAHRPDHPQRTTRGTP